MPSSIYAVWAIAFLKVPAEPLLSIRPKSWSIPISVKKEPLSINAYQIRKYNMLIFIISNKRIAQQCAVMSSASYCSCLGKQERGSRSNVLGARSNGKVNANGDRSSPTGNLAGE